MIFLANLIEHDAVVGDNCHISTASVINGDVRVGDGVFFGSNATAKNGVIIEQNSLIPMASSVKLGGAALKSRILEIQNAHHERLVAWWNYI